MQTIKHLLINFYHTLSKSVPLAIVFSALILGSSHIIYGIVLADTQEGKQVSLFAGRPVDATDLIVGNTESKVIVVEYSDTECPFCAQLQPTIKKIKEEYSSRVGFVYRYFPLTQIHPNAFEEAQAIYCVGKSLGAKKREQYINDLFSYKLSKQNMTLPKGGKEALAKNIGMDGAILSTCILGQESHDVVNNSMQEGMSAGVEGTPATFVLVKKGSDYEVVAPIDGARPYEYFKAVIDEALTR